MSQTLLFLGATGGVANACLTSALKSNQYKAIALVRTPEKLRKQLVDQQGLEENMVSSNLTIIQGNALDLSNVKRALLANIIEHGDIALPSMIISGLGGAPALNLDIRHPLQIGKLDNPTICEDAAKTLITALKEVYSERPSLSSRKPGVCFVSTTGISRGPEDVPFGMQFLYHQMLALPHADKKKMETTFRDHMLQSEPVFASVTGIRPTLLRGTGALNEGAGIEKLRVGVESRPAAGFTVQRADVGAWMFENVVKESEGGKWRGEMVSLTA
ncbi:hypothetical protein LTR70_002576 [Exophiala xenobiotica]|uniref:NAD(P)-binding domain-containing protein n=1 Tax=Lithohypha guttulata TaxID=1690604 RepID=A0ABR0KIE6_9EURO|nr:hypothetical protein LTR24_002247 [Lithohypha guttulata]KAK5325197.1 hypothetical protein LTR70_002576 [Exophiala xenobiotica]